MSSFKHSLLWVAAAVLTAVALMIACRAQSAPFRMSETDQLHGRAASSDLDNIQRQVNEYLKAASEAAKPKQAELSAAMNRVCSAAKIEVSDCAPNWQTGIVDHKPKEAKNAATPSPNAGQK
jgi:hypothetical protein